MNLWDKLFTKQLTSADCLTNVKEIERQQRSRRRELEIQQQEKAQHVKEAVAAEKAGKTELVREIFRDLRQLDVDMGHLDKQLHRLSLARLAMKHYSRKLQVLEDKKDRKGISAIIESFQSSGIQAKIDAAEVSEEQLESELGDVLTEVETQVSGRRIREDAGFEEFRKTISTIAQSEDAAADPEAIASKYSKDIDRAIKGAAERADE